MPASLYLHVPFCPQVCPYCDFHKMLRHEGLAAAYLDRLEEEIEETAQLFPGPLETVYLGGGTPSALEDAELARVAAALDAAWGLPATLETTLEADPLTFDPARLRLFRELGFTRLSIGAQSTQDAVLRRLGRSHGSKDALDAIDWALEAGFEVSADLMTAVPGQDTEQDLRALIGTGLSHISVYTLTIEPYTPFAIRGVAVDEDRAADDYELTNRILSEHGLARYEVSSHARPGHESLHNQVYWHGKHYLGLGPSAAGFLPVDGQSAPVGTGRTTPAGTGSATLAGTGTVTSAGTGPATSAGTGPATSAGEGEASRDLPGMRVTNRPIKGWLAHEAPERQPVSPHDYVLERLMTGLRTLRGVDLDDVRERSGIDVQERFAQTLSPLEKHGLLEFEGRRLRATPEGLVRLDSLLRQFFAVEQS